MPFGAHPLSIRIHTGRLTPIRFKGEAAPSHLNLDDAPETCVTLVSSSRLPKRIKSAAVVPVNLKGHCGKYACRSVLDH